MLEKNQIRFNKAQKQKNKKQQKHGNVTRQASWLLYDILQPETEATRRDKHKRLKLSNYILFTTTLFYTVILPTRIFPNLHTPRLSLKFNLLDPTSGRSSLLRLDPYGPSQNPLGQKDTVRQQNNTSPASQITTREGTFFFFLYTQKLLCRNIQCH